ncbi:MAG: hypothetical protein R8J84_08870 [Mariprofundales bacterium]
MKRVLCLVGALALLATADSAYARSSQVVAPYPMQLVLAVKKGDVVYPSVAGRFLVYTQRDKHGYTVVRVPVSAPQSDGLRLRSEQSRGAIRRGLALRDGSVGYISDRMGPISAWRRWANSDLHQLIASGGSFIGGTVPLHLAANANGSVWAVDTYLNRERRARFLDTFANPNIDGELLAQNWRLYWSDADHWKVGYKSTERGVRNKFAHPALLVQGVEPNGLTMIRNAFDATISADGHRVAFVREQKGNFDLWMQDMVSGALTRLTSDRFGDFEPAFSPDGTKIAFVSNRSSRGSVRRCALYVVDLGSGAITQVTASRQAMDGGPSWKNRHTILFHSNRNPRKPQQSTDKQWRLWEVQL